MENPQSFDSALLCLFDFFLKYERGSIANFRFEGFHINNKILETTEVFNPVVQDLEPNLGLGVLLVRHLLSPGIQVSVIKTG